MESLSEVDVADFEAALTAARLRPLQFLHAGFGLSAATLCVILVVLSATGSFSADEFRLTQLQMVKGLSVANFVLFFGCYYAGGRLFSAQFSPSRLAQAVHKDYRDPAGRPIATAAGKCVAIIRKATLIRLVSYDLAASFAFATCLLAILWGVMAAHPSYWLNGAPCLLLIGYVLLTLPTANRLRVLFLIKIAGASRLA